MTPEEEILHEPIEEHELPDEKPSRIKQYLILAAGLFLVLLMISSFFAGYPVGRVLQGQLESDPLVDNTLDLHDLFITFENGTYEELRKLYFADQTVEFAVCMSGSKEGPRSKPLYTITSLYQPKVISQGYAHVTFETCTPNTLIALHTHPYKSCIASDTDINTLEKMQERNKDTIMVIMCEPDRFSVYS